MKISTVIGLFLGSLLMFSGCGGDDDGGEQAADGGAGLGGDMGGGAGTAGAGTGGGAGTDPTAGAGGTAGVEPTAGTGGTAGTPPVAGEGGAGVGGEPVVDGGAATDAGDAAGNGGSSACEELAACCETIAVADRNSCRSIAETGVEAGCEVYVPIYCNGSSADGGTAVDGGTTPACQELAACCALQTFPMAVTVCEMAVDANVEADCEALLTSGLEALPFVEPCS